MSEEKIIEPENRVEKPLEIEKETKPENLEQVLETQDEQVVGKVEELKKEGQKSVDELGDKGAEVSDIEGFEEGKKGIDSKADEAKEEYENSFRTPGDIESYIRSQSKENGEDSIKEEDKESKDLFKTMRGIKSQDDKGSKGDVEKDKRDLAEKEAEIDELMAGIKREVESVSSSSDSPAQKKANLDTLFSKYVDTLNKYQIDSNHPKAKEVLDSIREVDAKRKKEEKALAEQTKESEDSFRTPGDIESQIESKRNEGKEGGAEEEIKEDDDSFKTPGDIESGIGIQRDEGDEGGVREENKGDLAGKE